MADELLEGQAFEEPVAEGEAAGTEKVRRLPEPARPTELEAWRGEVRTVALAAAGGVVAGAATVAAVRAVRGGGRRSRGRGLLGRRQEREVPQRILASRSFLVDVHLLGR